jgi:hypothetical protein
MVPGNVDKVVNDAAVVVGEVVVVVGIVVEVGDVVVGGVRVWMNRLGVTIFLATSSILSIVYL